MAKNIYPKTKVNRRFGHPIFAAKKAMERKPYFPGQHGPKNKRRKETPYSKGLIQKQMLRLMYGLQEKQFRNAFDKAKRQKGVTGEIFMSMLETRLDNVVYRLGFGRSRFAARQFVNHGHILVNGQKVDIPSYQCAAGDVVTVKDRTSSKQFATRSLDGIQYRMPPAWLSIEADALKGTVNRMPTPEELQSPVNVQLIVQFYSR